jgi:cell division protein FtsB
MLVIETATLLYHSYPAIMHPNLKVIAAAFGSITIESFLLMICVNIYLLKNRFGEHGLPVVFGIFSTIMTLFFMDAFSPQATAVVVCMRVFVSVLFGLINYLLGEIFTKKYKEHQQEKIHRDQLLTDNEQLLQNNEQLLQNKEHLEKRIQDLKYEKEVLHTENVQYKLQNHDQLVTDHDQLVSKHEQLLSNYDQLVSKHDQLLTEVHELKAHKENCIAKHSRPKTLVKKID